MEPVTLISNTLGEIATNFITHLPQIIVALIILGITYLLAKYPVKWIGSGLGKTRMRVSLNEVITQLATILIWVAGITVAAIVVFPTLTPARVLTAIGLSSIAIGFAFKDIFENFLAGIMILSREPFRIGDFIECNKIIGAIELITIRDTHLRQSNGQRVVMPNAMLLRNDVRVITDLELNRVMIYCSIAYSEQIEAAKKVIKEAVVNTKTVSDQYNVDVFAHNFADSGIEIEVAWWTKPTPYAVRESTDLVMCAIKSALNKANIEIPFPYRTLTFKQPIKIEQTEQTQPTKGTQQTKSKSTANNNRNS